MKLSELNQEIHELNEWVAKIGDPNYDPEIYLKVNGKATILQKVTVDFNLGPVELHS